MNKIPMVDLYAQYQSIKKEIDEAIAEVISATAFVGGKYVEKLEREIANYIGTKYAVAVNSGTDALYLSLWAMGIGKGDEVITTPFTFFATAEVISLVGAKPVFIDVDAKTFNIDVSKIEEKITSKTKAIIPVHLFGLPADMDEIMEIAKKHKLRVVEDACQAIGAEYKGRKVGSIGDTGAFSFFPSKNLGGYGDGGMIVTNNEELAEQCSTIRNHGSKIKYQNDFIGVNSRLDGLQAAILSVKLAYLDKWNVERKRVADAYNRLLADIDWLTIPRYDMSDRNHVYHQYTLQISDNKRDDVRKKLDLVGISNMIYYPTPLHMLKAFEYLDCKEGSFPIAESLAYSVLSLPIYPEMRERDVEDIFYLIDGFY